MEDNSALEGKGKVFKLKHDRGVAKYQDQLNALPTVQQRTFGKNAMRKFRMYSAARTKGASSAKLQRSAANREPEGESEFRYLCLCL